MIKKTKKDLLKQNLLKKERFNNWMLKSKSFYYSDNKRMQNAFEILIK